MEPGKIDSVGGYFLELKEGDPGGFLDTPLGGFRFPLNF